jgi:hypothetical protein
MHLARTVNTRGVDPERRAVDVNRPVTSLLRSCCGAGRAGTNRYRGIDIPRSPGRVHNRAATVRESGKLLAVKPFCIIVAVSKRMSGCHAPCVCQSAMHLARTVNTPGVDPERRAVDVNRPVTSLLRSCCGAGRAGTNRYRGIDIPRSPRRVHNRAATVRESGKLLAVKPFCTIVSASKRMLGCHAPCAHRKHAWCRS